MAIAKALMAKKSINAKDFAKLGIAGLIAPLFALAMSLEIVQKIVQIASIVTPIMQIVSIP
jgi:hypothetical protein